MRASSPPIAIYKTPLKGMDTREVKPQDAPNLLFNVDLSNRGYWKERPGVRKFIDTGSSRNKIVGLYAKVIKGSMFVFIIHADTISKRMTIRIVDGVGSTVFGPASLTDYAGAPYDPNNYYSFVNAGNFVYFCNGTSVLWEAERVGSNFFLRQTEFEEGKTPLVLSYIEGNMRPRSFTYFYDQIIASGFIGSTECPLSIPSDFLEEQNVPPRDLLNLQRDAIDITSSIVLASEPALWKSYPVNDPSGLFWIYNEEVLCTAGINYDLLVFGTKRLYRIQGFGTPAPKRVRLGDTPAVSTRGVCYFDRFVFFVSYEGCYITDGTTVRKVSFEMDSLWFGRQPPQSTRYVEQQIQKGPYPFYVNRKRLSEASCVNDQTRQQVMVSLPANDSQVSNMVWVYNYSDLISGAGQGKWSIWGGSEDPTFQGTSLDGNPFTDSNNDGTPDRNNPAASPSQSNTTYNMFNWLCMAEEIHNGEQRIFVANDIGRVYEFGISRQDLREVRTYDRSGSPTGDDTPVHFPVAISLGRVGRVDSDGRIICTNIAVRRKQLSKNVDDSSTATKLQTIVRSEGEGLKHFDAQETDVEFEDTILNSQQGVSENTTSTLNTLKLGEKPTGTSSPLMQSEYIEAYARVNVPDEEGRAAYVDLYSMPTSEPHRMQISEVRVHANIKGGSQREQS